MAANSSGVVFETGSGAATVAKSIRASMGNGLSRAAATPSIRVSAAS